MNASYLPEIFLHPGEFHFGTAPGRIGTLLGSCIAVTIWHPLHRYGGMCHILLPNRPHAHDGQLDCRYADEAVARFANELKTCRVLPSTCQVRLFGGGSILVTPDANGPGVGTRNIEATRTALLKHGFQIMTEDVGGNQKRRLVLDLSNGHAWTVQPQTPSRQFPRKDAP